MITLDRVTAADLMQTNLVTVTPETTVRALTRLLSDHQISGAPVVDSAGRILGVVSSTDVLRLAADDTDFRIGAFPPLGLSNETDEASGDDEQDLVAYFTAMDATVVAPDGIDWIDGGTFDERTVEDIMTPVHFSVRSDASLTELAELMVRGRIHRTLVVDEGDLRGIVTSFDVLKVVAGG